MRNVVSMQDHRLSKLFPVIRGKVEAASVDLRLLLDATEKRLMFVDELIHLINEPVIKDKLAAEKDGLLKGLNDAKFRLEEKLTQIEILLEE